MRCIKLQRHVARALWHLAAAAETRQLLAARTPALALHRLASTSRNLQGRDLAHQALRRLWDDTSIRDRMPLELQPPLDARPQNRSHGSLVDLNQSAGGLSGLHGGN